MKFPGKGAFSEPRAVARIRRLLANNELSRAIELIERQSRRNPDSPWTRLLRAEWLQASGDTNQALLLLKEFAAAPSNCATRVVLAAGGLLEQANEIDGALDVYGRATGHPAPQVAAHAHWLRARVLYRQRRYGETIEELARGLGHIDHSTMYTMLTPLLVDSNDFGHWRSFITTMRAAEDAPARRKSTEFYLALADAYARCNEFDQSINYLQKAHAARSPGTRPEPGGRFHATNELVKPAFLIIGGMKCGTTSLFEQITHHPQVAAPVRKEIQFFQFQQAPLQWYLAHFPERRAGKHWISGEASPGYLVRPIQPRVRELFPDIKLICILRNPARRALSHWHHVRRQGRVQSQPDSLLAAARQMAELTGAEDAAIERALCEEPVRSRERNILTQGFYYYFLRRWFRHFPADQMLLLTLSELSQSPRRTMGRVFEFLGLRPKRFVRSIVKNAAGRSRGGDDASEIHRALSELYRPSMEKLRSEYGVDVASHI